jgi:hypothetical protein
VANAACNGVGVQCSSDALTVLDCEPDANSCIVPVAGSAISCNSPSLCQSTNGVPAYACLCPTDSGSTAVNAGCTAAGQTACDPSGAGINTCTSFNNCLVWRATTSCDPGLVCGTASGAADCQCPANTGTTLYVDPVNGSDHAAGVYPTGVDSPASCRFGTLTHALGLAVSGTTVEATGGPGVFAAVTDGGNAEVFPLNVPTRVTLTTSESPLTSSSYQILFSGSAATGGVVLGSGSTLSGFGLVNASGATSTGTGILCSSGAATVDVVSLDGQSGLTSGVHVTGTCALTATTLQVTNVLGTGIVLDSTDASSLALSHVSACGQNATAANAKPGIALSAGSLTLSSMTATNNGASGLFMSGGSTTLTPDPNVPGSSFSQNGQSQPSSAGILVTGGTLSSTDLITTSSNRGIGLAVQSLSSTGSVVTLSSLFSNGNGAQGVQVTGAATQLTIHTLTAASNVQQGLNMGQGTVTLDVAAAINYNGSTAGSTPVAGIRAENGTLNIGSQTGTGFPFVVSSNGLHGLQLVGAAVNAYQLDVHDNAADGVRVLSSTGKVITVANSHIHANVGNGVLLQQSPLSSSGASTTFLQNSEIDSNGAFGVRSSPGSNSSVGAQLADLSIHGNASTGVEMEPSSSLSMTNLDVTGNFPSASGATDIGGIRFNGGVLRAGGFTGNHVHSNGSHQLGFTAGHDAAALGNTDWDISQSACGSTNQVSCYANGKLGIYTSSSATVGFKVNATGTSWEHNPAIAGTDFSNTSITVASPCAAITTCP